MSAGNIPYRRRYLRPSVVGAANGTDDAAQFALCEQVEVLGTRDRCVENRVQVLPHPAILEGRNRDRAGEWPTELDVVRRLARAGSRHYGIERRGLAMGSHVEGYAVDLHAAGSDPCRSPRVYLGGILELEIIYLVSSVRQCRQGLVHIRESWRDQGRAFQLTYVGIPGCKGAPL